MDYQKKTAPGAGDQVNAGQPGYGLAPGRTTAVEQLQRSTLGAPVVSGIVQRAPASTGGGQPAVAQSSAPPAPAHNTEPAYADKAAKDIPDGVTNLTATLDWDKSAKLYGIDGPAAASLRGIYEKHLRGEMAGEPLMLELGVQALAPSEVGARIDRMADGTEPVFVGAEEKTGAKAAQPYRQALWRCSQRAIIATLSTSKSIRYKTTPGTTYCNVYSADMVNAMGGYLPRVWYNENLEMKLKLPEEKLKKLGVSDLNANQIGSWLKKWGTDYGWRQIGDAKQAQEAANSGKVVITQASKADATQSGHVNVIIAEGNLHHAQGTGADFQPLQSQAGAHNYEYSDNAAQPNSPGWWKAPDDGGAQGKDAMKKEPGGNFWIYEGSHQATAVASATEMGGTFK